VITAYRLGSKSASQASDRRSILVKLRDGEIKNDILQACRTTKPARLFVGDNLTPIRASILYALRQVKKKCPDKLEYCGSRDGRVFIWIKSAGASGRNQKMSINTFDLLLKICDEHFNVDPSQFINIK